MKPSSLQNNSNHIENNANYNDPHLLATQYEQKIKKICCLSTIKDRSIDKILNDYKKLLIREYTAFDSIQIFVKFAMMLLWMKQKEYAQQIMDIACKRFSNEIFLQFIDCIGNDDDNTSDYSEDDKKQHIVSMRRKKKKSFYYPYNISISKSNTSWIKEQVLIASDNDTDNDTFSELGSIDNDASNSVFPKKGDPYYDLKSVDESSVSQILSNKTISMESLIEIKLQSKNSYIDVAGLLAENHTNLYLISCINYRIWLDFMYRSKIDELMDDENKCTVDVASKLINNWDIIDNVQINAKMMYNIVGNTKNKIKTDILLNRSEIINVFNSKKDTNYKLKYVHCIIIDDFYNTDILPREHQQNLLKLLFSESIWDQDKKDKSIIITLRNYHKQCIIHILNKQKYKYFKTHKLQKSAADKLIISSYDSCNKIEWIHQQIRVINMKQFNLIIIDKDNNYDTQYQFILRDDKNTDIELRVCSNNIRHSWITHLNEIICDEPVINNISDIVDDQKNDKISKVTNSLKNRFINNLSNNDINHDQYSHHFGFGIYLNYWQHSYSNTVYPKYKTLKDELLNNNISRITQKQYHNLYIECCKLLRKSRNKLRAKNIGINNKKFEIPKGSIITINHLISLKLYTDYDIQQKEFKKHCRKYDDDESMADFIKRNSEIYHFCRYLKESCMFYGELMDENKIIYVGLNIKLMFNSMSHYFECPCSSTEDRNIANEFSGSDGLILELKAANTKSRCLDVEWLSCYQHERERIIMGTSLKICDIYVEGKSTKKYISGLQIFEQIINAHFIDTNFDVSIEKKLYLLLQSKFECNQCKYKGPEKCEITTHSKIPKYIMELFENMINRMQIRYNSNSFWMMKKDWNSIRYQALRLIFENGKYLEYFQMNKENIRWVSYYQKTIDGNILKQMQPRQYKKLPKWKINDFEIYFHLKYCRIFSNESPNVAIYFVLDSLPNNISEIKIEYDLLCIVGTNRYQQTMPSHSLSIKNKSCGFQMFQYGFNKIICKKRPFQFTLKTNKNGKTIINEKSSSSSSSSIIYAINNKIVENLKCEEIKRILEEEKCPFHIMLKETVFCQQRIHCKIGVKLIDVIKKKYQ